MRFDFTDGVRIALSEARAEATRRGHDYVGPEHMALALFREGVPGPELPGVDRQRVRRVIEATYRPGKVVYPSGHSPELPYTSTAKKALQGALDEARARNDAYVDTEHLLIGVLGANKVLSDLLESCGVTPVTVRLGEAATPPAAEPPGPDVWFLQLDPDADTPLYEQIIRAVEEAVATGELPEGERLPPVRQLAAELEIAPGTVARAYQALEEKGVVVTEGARGTRVAPRDRGASPDDERAATLEGLFRSAVVAAFHMGAKAKEVRSALDRAMKGIYGLLG